MIAKGCKNRPPGFSRVNVFRVGKDNFYSPFDLSLDLEKVLLLIFEETLNTDTAEGWDGTVVLLDSFQFLGMVGKTLKLGVYKI